MADAPSWRQKIAGGGPTAEPEQGLPQWYKGALQAYPGAQDIAAARKSDFGYGTGNEAFIGGQIANQWSLPPKGGKPALPIGVQDVSKAGGRATSLATDPQMRNITPGSPQTADAYGQAQLAVLRSPIAALGFDPRAAALDTKTGKDVSLAGIFSPEKDSIYSNVAFPSNLVHESIHRGMKKLRGAGVLTPELEKRLPKAGGGGLDEEAIVRFVMAADMGDPEKSSSAGEKGSPGEKERKEGITSFGRDFKDPTATASFGYPLDGMFKGHLDALKELTDKAAAYYAKQRPGGPR